MPSPGDGGGSVALPIRLVLASASPARLATLRAAGVEPEVRVADVDEDAILADAVAQGEARGTPLTPAEQVLALARAKAVHVAGIVDAAPAGGVAVMNSAPDPVNARGSGSAPPPSAGRVRPPGSPGVTLVLGCDSMLELDGVVAGKPHTPEVAIDRWRSMRGNSGRLHTGHHLIAIRHMGSPDWVGVGASSTTVVHFADLSDGEIEAYVATGEPLHVAGAFTIDGRGGPYVTGIEGDHHGVVGLSLPLFRDLLGDVGILFHALWRRVTG